MVSYYQVRRALSDASVEASRAFATTLFLNIIPIIVKIFKMTISIFYG